MEKAVSGPTLDRTVTTWMGRDINELSREELIAALAWSVRAYHETLQSSIRASEMQREFAKAARRW